MDVAPFAEGICLIGPSIGHPTGADAFPAGEQQEPVDSPVVDLSNCEREPIHIPGLIQPHGVLLVIVPLELRVVFASANTESILGIPVEQILAKPVKCCLDPAVYQEFFQPELEGPSVFESQRSLSVQTPDGLYRYYELRFFNELLYLEIEPDVPSRETASLPTQTQTVIGKMRAAGSLRDLLDFAAIGVRQLTGFDRVMIYQFHEDGHGQVVAEDCEAEMEPYLDLHYPASDIPAQARKLYLMQRIRVIADCSYAPVSVFADRGRIAGANGSLEPLNSQQCLDMSFCNLRSVSPIHLEYLSNMGVGATLSLSLIVDDTLWGLIVCHHRTSRLPSPALRSSCDLISQITSFLIRARIELDEFEGRKRTSLSIESIADHLEQHEAVSEALASAGDQILPLVGASGALISFEGKMELVGAAPPLKDAVALMHRLRTISGGKVFAHNALAELLPQFKHLQREASGVMLMPMLGSMDNAILWFRPEAIETVKWGGNPDKSVEINQASGRISPRKSFEVWRTTVEGFSVPWKPADIKAAHELRRTISDYLLARAEGTLTTLGLIDTLTLLPNRRRFQNELRLRTENLDTQQVAVILINLDRFNQVNQAFGHGVGDDLLMQVTRRLSKEIEADMLLARLGADEFAVLCNGDTPARVDEIAAGIVSSLDYPFHLSGRPFRITASIGIAHAAQGDKELLRAADTAMHVAKRSGRNRLVSFNKLLQDTAVDSLELQQDLYRAVDANELKLVYQPIVALPAGTLHGFEALLRWQHPVRGMISPLEFIPMAEETGLIVPIGHWVLQKASDTVMRWNREFAHPFTIHVNVAAPQLIAFNFVEQVKTLIEQTELDPGYLSIEVTESVLMRDLAVDSLTELKSLGLEVSIDDFGTGYSSLAYLQKLPVDIVKIDKSFINDIALNNKSREFLGALLGLTKTLHLKSIAEGVETEDQRQILADLGCDFAQGYLFARPLDESSAEKLIADSQKLEWTLV